MKLKKLLAMLVAIALMVTSSALIFANAPESYDAPLLEGAELLEESNELTAGVMQEEVDVTFEQEIESSLAVDEMYIEGQGESFFADAMSIPDAPDNFFSDVALLDKTLVLDEDFSGGVAFSGFNGYEDGTWERFRYSSDDNGATVSSTSGKITLTPGSALIKSGVRYNLPAQTGSMVIQVTAKRLSDAPEYLKNGEPLNYYGNELKLNVHYDKENKYSYSSMNGDLNGWNRLSIEPGLGETATGYFLVKANSAKVYSMNPETGGIIATRDATVDSSSDEEAWDCIELFSVGATYEILSVKIYNYDAGPVFLNEDFETFANKSNTDLKTALEEKGYTVGGVVSGHFTVVKWGSDPSYCMRFGTANAVNDNASVTIPLPNDLPSEFYLKFKMKNHSTLTNFVAILSFDGTNGTAGSNDYVISNSKMNYNNSYTYTDGKTLNGTSWSTFVLHINGTNADAYIQNASDSGFTKVAESIPARSRSNAKNYLMLTGAAWIDDVQIFAPGLHYTGTQIKKNGDTVTAEASFVGAVVDSRTNPTRNLTGVFANYDDKDMARAITFKSNTVQQLLNSGGKMTIGPLSTANAVISRFYLWDGIGENQLQIQEEQPEAVELSIQ